VVEGGPVAEQFPPHVLRQYALLADGERGILIGPRGDFCWMCFPRWDSAAMFNSLLGGRGIYAVSPDEPRFVWGGYYEGRSLIWRSRWVTNDAIVESREALVFPGNAHTAVVLRRIRALDHPARVRITLDVRSGYGTKSMSNLSCNDGVWTGRSEKLRFRWTGAAHAQRCDDGRLEAVLDITPGSHHDLILEFSDHEISAETIRPDDNWQSTENAWNQTVPEFSGTLADVDVRGSYAVLRGLTSSSGGMVAAATMSLPEHAQQGRNYDYRYCWIRDQCYVGQAVAVAGAHPLLDDAVRFVSERILTDGPALKPAYSATGDAVPEEHDLDLPGYPGGADVKVGNWVTDQFQLDAYGEALLLLAAAARLDRMDLTNWQAAQTAVDAIEKRWQDADAGIWELDDQRWAHSRLTCAAGLRAIGAVAPAQQGSEWQRLADLLISDTDNDCLHPSGRWQRAPDDSRVDAALLLPSIRGAIPAKDPRTIATLDAVRAELSQDGFVYRFRPDQRPLGEAEGAFLLCGFMMALADHQQGNDLAAVRWFERNRTACGPPGLFTEEYDVVQRQLRGNLPQAFVHALMFETAHRLTEVRGAEIGEVS
jgi:GH15 family glucan-1,4-alpha-glucosidase